MKRRRRNLEKLEQHFIDTSNAPGTQQNICSCKKWYMEFCHYSETRPFPVTEFKLTKFASYLTDMVKTVETIKRYCGTMCQENELRGYRPAKRGIRFYKTITGIRKQMRHKIKQAEPMTDELLHDIRGVVNYHDDRQFVVWVALLTGFKLILCKGNIVPLKRMHDAVHIVSRQDVAYGNGLMVIDIKWSKTNQFGEYVSQSPMMVDNSSKICPVRWIWYMVHRIPAAPHHNLFSYKNKHAQVVPITYRDLMVNLREWLKKVGVKNNKSFSSHSLRRGATTLAHERNIDEQTIMRMGGWTSQCYRRYIQVGVKHKLKAWKKFSGR